MNYRCLTPRCRNRPRPQPGALYCEDCHAHELARLDLERDSPKNIAIRRHGDKQLPARPWPTAETDWTTGRPNVTCPACEGRYHYGAPAPFTHLCPLCQTWLCWRETDELKEFARRLGRPCPTCGGGMTERPGKFGKFWGCDSYPKCKGIRRTADCDTLTETRPRLGLDVWTPPGESVEREFGEAVDAARRRYDRLEAREARFKKWARWQGRRAALGQREWEAEILR